MTPPDTDPSTDALLHAIADPQRRVLLRALAEADDTEVPLPALEASVARARQGGDVEFQSRNETAIRLRHVHLPTLEGVGLVHHDEQRDCVEYYPDEFVESLLDFLESRRRLSA